MCVSEMAIGISFMVANESKCKGMNKEMRMSMRMRTRMIMSKSK